MARMVVVSGGGTGIGRAVAERFVRAGDRVLILGRRAAVLEESAQTISAQVGGTGHVQWMAADLTKVTDVERVTESLAHQGGCVDVLVHGAGGADRAATPDLVALRAQWMRDYEANVMSAVLLTQALRPSLRRPGARIVLMSSIAAVRGGGDSYSAAKAALIGWTYSLAAELGADGITVNAVAPGYVTGTEFFADRMTTERHQRLVAATINGRAGEPQDIAAAVFFLAAAEAAHVTGQVLHVNGGAAFGR